MDSKEQLFDLIKAFFAGVLIGFLLAFILVLVNFK
jgi:tetrahydromethanopterin S-methyltransferase subunit F